MKRTTMILSAVAAAALVAAPAAMASDDEIRRNGECTGASTSKIKVKPDDGRLEVEFEVDQNNSGEKWKVKLRQNGNIVFKGTRTTGGASGSFSLERKLANTPGDDRFVGTARNKQSGERCSAGVGI